MALTSTPLASGPEWQANDVLCDAGPAQPAFEEAHDAFCIAAVTEGTFRYRSSRGAALLTPGALLLGEAGDGFVCSHEHGTGDRCLSFRYAPAFFETIASGVPNVRATAFGVPRLPALASHLPLLSALEGARERRDPHELEEAAVALAGAVMGTLAASDVQFARVNARDEARVAHALRCVEEAPTEAWALRTLAAEAAMSPYHFLRTFRRVVGMTPHQWLLHVRFRRVATALRASDAPVATLAYEAGFGDLSTFNRRFRSVFGVSPSAYRVRARGR